MTTSLTKLDGSKADPFRRLYDGPPQFRDEMVDPEGGLRPDWRTFLRALNELGFSEVTRRWEDARQLIREHGVAKLIVDQGDGVPKQTQMAIERWAQSQLIDSADVAEAVQAFMQKRPPKFRGA